MKRTSCLALLVLVEACATPAAAPSGVGGERVRRQAHDRNDETSSAPSPEGEAAANHCESDSDCMVAMYPDPQRAGTCCPAVSGRSCVPPVVTGAEAERRQRRWKEQCAGTRCPPSASCATGVWEPEPRCVDSVCVDAAEPSRKLAHSDEAPSRADAAEPPRGAEPSDALVPCTGILGNVLTCGGERIYGLTVSPAGDGTFHRLSWRRYYRSTKRWRDIALHDTGLIHFIVDPGAGNAKKWWTLSRWIFPRTHRISVARHPESLRFEVRDSAGVVWILEGTPQTQTRTSFEVKSIGGAPQRAGGLERNDAGILGVALGELYPILLEHNVHSYSPYAKYRARAYLNKKSVVRDQQGRACALSNRDLFLQTTDPTRPDSKLPFSTDPKWAQFLSRRCPQLDIEAIAHAQPPRPVPARRFSK